MPLLWCSRKHEVSDCFLSLLFSFSFYERGREQNGRGRPGAGREPHMQRVSSLCLPFFVVGLASNVTPWGQRMRHSQTESFQEPGACDPAAGGGPSLWGRAWACL